MRLYKFGGVLLPEPNTSERLSSQFRSGLLKLRNGSFDQDGQASVLQPYVLPYKAEIVSDIDATMQALANECAKGRNLLQRIDRTNTTLHQTWAKALQIAFAVSTDDYECRQEVSIQFEVDYPYWVHRDDEPLYFDDGHRFDTGLFFDGGHFDSKLLTGASHSLTIDNTGGVAVRRGLITVIPRAGGTLTNLLVENQANGMRFTWEGSLAAADRLEIDLLTQTVYKNADPDYDAFDVDSTQQGWMLLELGTNDILIENDGITGGVDFYWSWSRHYL